MYAIVDIETTGSYASGNRITEIAIVILHNGTIVERFDSLVNPCMPIPYFIQNLTGISDEMVAGAPLFSEIAQQVFNLLYQKVFVAHNVNFDYSFVRSMLADHGYELNSRKLCTVQLSRKLLPGLPSYKLGLLCSSLGIANHARHRASGDAEATTILFLKLIEHDHEGQISSLLKENRAATRFPPNLPFEQYTCLPTGPGIYYFHDQKGKVVYIGKAKNIKSRVNGHFSSGMNSRQKQGFLTKIHSISHRSTGTELMAAILEDSEIKRLWPEFNKAQKHRIQQFGLYIFEDQNGYERLGIEKIKPSFPPVLSFYSLAEGYSMVVKLIKNHQLCPKLCFIQRNTETCAAYLEGNCEGACLKNEPPEAYNKRLRKAVHEQDLTESFAIIGRGLSPEDQSCILVVNGKLFGMGYIPATIAKPSLDLLKTSVDLIAESPFSKRLIMKYTSISTSDLTRFN